MAYVLKAFSYDALAGLMINFETGTHFYENGKGASKSQLGFHTVSDEKINAKYSIRSPSGVIYVQYGDYHEFIEKLESALHKMNIPNAKYPIVGKHSAIYTTRINRCWTAGGRSRGADSFDMLWDIKDLNLLLSKVDPGDFEPAGISIICDPDDSIDGEGFIQDFKPSMIRLSKNITEHFPVICTPTMPDRIMLNLLSNIQSARAIYPTGLKLPIKNEVVRGEALCKGCESLIFIFGARKCKKQTSYLCCICWSLSSSRKYEWVKFESTVEQALQKLTNDNPERVEILRDLQEAEERSAKEGGKIFVGKKYVFVSDYRAFVFRRRPAEFDNLKIISTQFII